MVRRARPSSTLASTRGNISAMARAAGCVASRSCRNAARIEAMSSWPSTRETSAGRDDVAGDEAAERAAEPGLLGRDDGGVRDRQSERMAKQGGDREPVRQAADQPRLGARLQQRRAEAGRQGVGKTDQSAHAGEDASREATVARQAAAEIGVGIWLHVRRVATGSRSRNPHVPGTLDASLAPETVTVYRNA